MKKYILYILLIFSISIEGRVYQTSDQQVRSIGYTTVDIYDTRIVSAKQDKGINYHGYNPTPYRVYSYQPQTSKTVNTYTHINTPTGSSGPRKSKERPFSGNWWEDLEDYARMNGVLGLGYDPNWPSYVDDDFWEEFLTNYPEYEEYVEQWFETHLDAPNNPFNTPIGDSIIPFLILLLLYVVYDLFIRHMLIPAVGQTPQNTRQ